MRIISDITGREYSDVNVCLAEEKAFLAKRKEEEDRKKKLAEQREKREAELKVAQKAMEDAQKNYLSLKKAFDKDNEVLQAELIAFMKKNAGRLPQTPMVTGKKKLAR